jgi:hypothetical protein
MEGTAFTPSTGRRRMAPVVHDRVARGEAPPLNPHRQGAPESGARELSDTDTLGSLQVSAERVDELHLARRLAGGGG